MVQALGAVTQRVMAEETQRRTGEIALAGAAASVARTLSAFPAVGVHQALGAASVVLVADLVVPAVEGVGAGGVGDALSIDAALAPIAVGGEEAGHARPGARMAPRKRRVRALGAIAAGGNGDAAAGDAGSTRAAVVPRETGDACAAGGVAEGTCVPARSCIGAGGESGIGAGLRTGIPVAVRAAGLLGCGMALLARSVADSAGTRGAGRGVGTALDVVSARRTFRRAAGSEHQRGRSAADPDHPCHPQLSHVAEACQQGYTGAARRWKTTPRAGASS